jgi:hypothetical protein
MPEELVEVAQEHGFDQVSDFYSRLPGQVYPPYIYGYKRDRFSDNSAAFWVQRSSQSDTTPTFYLILAEREYAGYRFEIKDSIKWTYPMGLLLYQDTSDVLENFVLISDFNTKGPKGVKLQDYGIQSSYDGNSDVFYLQDKVVYIRTFNDW